MLVEFRTQSLDVRLRLSGVEDHAHEEVAGLRIVELLGVENVEPAVEQRRSRPPATMPGRLAHDSVRMWRARSDMGAPPL